MSNPLIRRGFFRLFMSHLEQHLDFDRLSLESETFIDADLHKTMTDLLFHAPWRQRSEIFVAILMEHKSEGSVRQGPANLIFQLRAQEVALLRRFMDQHPGKKLPVVVLVGLYHGKRPYAGPRTVAETIEGPPEMIPERWRIQDTLIIDLCELEESRLAEDKLGLFLRVLKSVYDKDFITKYRQLLPMLKKFDVQHDDRLFLIALNKYMLSNAHWENLPEFREVALKSYSEEVGGAVMTIAELLKKEGEEVGLEKANINLVLKMSRKGYGLDAIADLSGLSLEKINLILAKAS